jgi:hypothetical protein
MVPSSEFRVQSARLDAANLACPPEAALIRSVFSQDTRNSELGTSTRLRSLEQFEYLPRLRMPSKAPFREDQRSVHRHLEGAAGGFPELELRLRKHLLELGDQTGRPRLIASDDAVFDADVHDRGE